MEPVKALESQLESQGKELGSAYNKIQDLEAALAAAQQQVASLSSSSEEAESTDKGILTLYTTVQFI